MCRSIYINYVEPSNNNSYACDDASKGTSSIRTLLRYCNTGILANIFNEVKIESNICIQQNLCFE